MENPQYNDLNRRYYFEADLLKLLQSLFTIALIRIKEESYGTNVKIKDIYYQLEKEYSDGGKELYDREAKILFKKVWEKHELEFR